MKDQSFHLVHWLSTPFSLRKTSQEFINLEKSLTWIVPRIGDALYARGIWKGDMMVADHEELETMGAPEICSKRLHAKEVIFPRQNGKFIYPVADGQIQFVGGDQELRTSTSIRDRPIRGEGQRDFLGDSEGSLPPLHDSFPDAGEAINEFRSMSRKLHVPPSR